MVSINCLAEEAYSQALSPQNAAFSNTLFLQPIETTPFNIKQTLYILKLPSNTHAILGIRPASRFVRAGSRDGSDRLAAWTWYVDGAIELIATHSEAWSTPWSRTVRTARSRTSSENLLVVLLVIAPPSQGLEPPANPRRFNAPDT